MSSLHLTDLRRGVAGTAAFRLTMRFAGMFVGFLLVFDLVVGAATQWVVGYQTRAEVEDALGEGFEAFENGGAAAVAALVADFSREDEDILFAHRAADGTQLAGSLALGEPKAGWSTVVPEGIDDDEAFWVKTARLPDGSWISAGTDSEAYHDVAELMLAGAIWTVAIVLPLALLSGALLSRNVLGRLARIAETAEGVREGKLSYRAPVSDASDEFDRLAASINAMLDTIQALTRNLRNVSVGIAHELRTPLARVRNRLVEMQTDPRDPETSRTAIEGALVEIDRALATFDALLKIGQIEADADRKGFELVPFSELVEEIVEVYRPVVAEQDRCLRSRIAPDVRLRGNRALLAQMISNLVENAIEHTPPGTTITLELNAASEGTSLIVQDDGPGIPPVDRERIFDRFYRLERSRGKPGNGLGLSLVRSICSLHGFDVSLSPDGPGTRFEVEF